MLAQRPADFRAQLQRSESFAQLPPGLRAHILELPDSEMNEDGVRFCLDLPEQLATALDHSFLIAFDEFQELAGLARKRNAVDPLPLMRSVWQRHQRCTYVVSGSGRSMLTNMVTREHSPFFQHFALLDLGPFATDEAERLLVDAAPAERPIPPLLARKAVAAIGGHPFYLQLLGEGLTSCEPPYDHASLKGAIQELLFSRTGRLSLYFNNQFDRLVGRSSYLAAVLEALAEGPQRITDLSRRIGSPSGSTAGRSGLRRARWGIPREWQQR